MFLGSALKIVSRPSGSEWVVTSPRGLWYRNSRVRSRARNGAPSTSIWSAAETLSAGEEITAPLTATRPAAIQASASRREVRPTRAITLAMRSPGMSVFSAIRGLHYALACAGHPRLYTRSGIKLVAGTSLAVTVHGIAFVHVGRFGGSPRRRRAR
jgi:hypothetical protein